MPSEARQILAIAPAEDILLLHAELLKHLRTKGLRGICRKLVATSSGGESTTYDFDCSLGEVAEAIRYEFQARGLSIPGIGPRQKRSRATVHLLPPC